MFGFLKSRPNPELRDTLFGDMLFEAWTDSAKALNQVPWSYFHEAGKYFSEQAADKGIESLRKVLDTPNLESRQYLQAWHFLRQHGHTPDKLNAKKVYGVVVENGLDKGSDLLAGYKDYSARYYNFSGAGVVWEHPNTSLNHLIDALISAGQQVANRIGVWEKPRRPVPKKGVARINFLTPSGLHFGEAPIDALLKDPMAAQVFAAATQLMLALVELAKNKC